VLEHGRDKLRSKRADLLVVNEVGESAGFEVAHNAAVVLGADGTSTEVPATTKDLLAHRIWDLITERLPAR
jgi:phosphopantothenoylcysteine decarboxylase/phosphopantothenate--cysteine ligase